MLSRALAAVWLSGEQAGADGPPMPVGTAAPPDQPARPEQPELVDPRAVSKRGRGGERGRIALLHAIAHIELNAVDLHWDIVARFTDTPLPRGFYSDWALAAAQEAEHFTLLCARMRAKGAAYGDLPAHAGMWRFAHATRHDLAARLAVVPMVLEARGLDVTPGMIDMFEECGDDATAEVLKKIYEEEVGHVAYGAKWFHFLCGRTERDPKPTFHSLVKRYFEAPIRPPFNDEKRAEAGLPLDFYWPLATDVAQ